MTIHAPISQDTASQVSRYTRAKRINTASHKHLSTNLNLKVLGCGAVLREDANGKLSVIDRCRHSACAVCSVVRAKSWRAKMKGALPVIEANHEDIKYINFNADLGPTRKVTAQSIGDAIDLLSKLFTKLIRRASIVGALRGIEVTESQGNAHPHLHALLIVKADLAPSMLALWWRSLVGHACQLNISTLPDRHDAVRLSHYLARGVEKTTRTPSPAFVDALVEAVYKRRLISASGVIAEAIRANAGASTKMKVNNTKHRTKPPQPPAPSVALHHWLTSTQQYKRVLTATHQASVTQGLARAQIGALTAPPTTPPKPTSPPPRPPIKPSGLWASCKSIAYRTNTVSLALPHSAGGQP